MTHQLRLQLSSAFASFAPVEGVGHVYDIERPTKSWVPPHVDLSRIKRCEIANRLVFVVHVRSQKPVAHLLKVFGDVQGLNSSRTAFKVTFEKQPPACLAKGFFMIEHAFSEIRLFCPKTSGRKPHTSQLCFSVAPIRKARSWNGGQRFRKSKQSSSAAARPGSSSPAFTSAPRRSAQASARPGSSSRLATVFRVAMQAILRPIAPVIAASAAVVVHPHILPKCVQFLPRTTLFHLLFPQIAPKILRCSTIFQKKVYSQCRPIATFMGSSECPPHMTSDDAKGIKNELR